ncbi:hypothetical protein DFQ26_000349 [Actinomortierella ambigua]|nr:hypothetical protein DFQ26_000349 [Actinomortierella ambigua]
MSQPSQRPRVVIPLTQTNPNAIDIFPTTGHKYIDEHIDTLASIYTTLENLTNENSRISLANIKTSIIKRTAELVLTAHPRRCLH